MLLESVKPRVYGWTLVIDESCARCLLPVSVAGNAVIQKQAVRFQQLAYGVEVSGEILYADMLKHTYAYYTIYTIIVSFSCKFTVVTQFDSDLVFKSFRFYPLQGMPVSMANNFDPLSANKIDPPGAW